MSNRKIKTALISVFSKEGLEPILAELKRLNVTIYSTGGTQKFIEEQEVDVTSIESLTGYPSILDGRVKTLHPKVFGGILARREEGHLAQLQEYAIPEIDLVIVDLYPFEQTVASTDDENAIIEKIDIGGVSLIRAAAKNFKDLVVVGSKSQYQPLENLLKEKNGDTDLADRKRFATEAFKETAHYDTAIFNYFNRDGEVTTFKQSRQQAGELRYGENPHQQAVIYGDLEKVFVQRNGKAISYNNLVDIDAAIQIMAEFKDDDPTVAILKHTNPCGVAQRETLHQAWVDALACDNQSAFGGILIANRQIDIVTAQEIDKIFYEVLIAPGFDEDAFEFLSKKSKRILLELKEYGVPDKSFKSLLSGVIEQETDKKIEVAEDLEVVTDKKPTETAISDLIFANKCVKHLKSNAIALAKDKQMIGMGCGQTSRVDALRHSIEKAGRFGFSVEGAVMASDAFFPFADSVEMAHKAGVTAVIQPGGSIRDKDSIAYCNEHDLAMVFTGTRHFKH